MIGETQETILIFLSTTFSPTSQGPMKKIVLFWKSEMQVPFYNYMNRGIQWHTQEKISGVQVMAGLVGGPGGGAPRTPENFRKFAKNSLRKLQKCSIIAYFSKNFQNPALNE